MRSVVRTATLVTIIGLGVPGLVRAQEPDPAPAPDVAVARSRPAVAARETETRAPASAQERRGADRALPRASERPTREPAPPAEASERALRVAPRAPAAAVAAGATVSEEQRSGGGQRRGAVRRPPAGGSGRTATRDRAVPRDSAPRQAAPIYVYPSYRGYSRYYDPWGYGAFGLGYLAYSPWAWSPYYYSPYGYGYGSGAGYGGGYGYGGGPGAYGYDVGGVRLKVEPRDAEVYVDNYFAGHVDDFDGMFQSLKLDSGGYRIEVRKPGYRAAPVRRPGAAESHDHLPRRVAASSTVAGTKNEGRRTKN